MTARLPCAFVIAFVSSMRAQPGRRAELLAILQDLVDEAERDEPGTLTYTFHTVDDDPDAVISYELFTDDAALEVHKKSEAVAAAIPKLRAVTVPGSVQRLVPAIGKGFS
jgi:quinol monooxygenase YgiN